MAAGAAWSPFMSVVALAACASVSLCQLVTSAWQAASAESIACISCCEWLSLALGSSATDIALSAEFNL